MTPCAQPNASKTLTCVRDAGHAGPCRSGLTTWMYRDEPKTWVAPWLRGLTAKDMTGRAA